MVTPGSVSLRRVAEGLYESEDGRFRCEKRGRWEWRLHDARTGARQKAESLEDLKDWIADILAAEAAGRPGPRETFGQGPGEAR